MVSTATLDDIRESADDLESETISFLQEMVRTPSENPPGEYEDIHDVVRGKFEENDWSCETVWTPKERLREFGIPEEYPRPNILATVSTGTGPTIALNAHLDTVPADPDRWSYDPFSAKIENNRLYGRGATDCKARIAAYTLAAEILERNDLFPDATIILAITADEETGGEAGPGYIVDAGHIDPDYVIVEGSSEQVKHAAAGVIHYTVTVTGESSHAGSRLDEGANALLSAARIITELEAYGNELRTRESDVIGIGSPTCTPATITGGIKTNVVPDRIAFTVDQRVPPDFNADDLESEFKNTVEAVDLLPGTDVSIAVDLRADSSWSDPDSPHVKAVQANAQAVLNRDIPIAGSRGFTDARFFANAGAKTVRYGPGDSKSNQHGIDESVALDQVIDSGSIVAASLIDIANQTD